jgi:hypothetical protein
MNIQPRLKGRGNDSLGGGRRKSDVDMRPLRQPSWGRAALSTLPASWRATRKPSVRASTNWKSPRMQLRDASAQKGGPPAVHRRAANLRREPPRLVAGVHGGRPKARRRAVDDPVAARVVTPSVGAGAPRQAADDPTAATQTPERRPHGTEDKDDGPSSRPHRPM